ncbi:ATP-binding cassette domain-containing protein [Nigerium massiliense]|uniref:ATP-binding cassette domain-containing protein n=1 Tax=Nigerium massiliense TaxID=1522317 RepID=UPI0009E55194|nr:ATP-binding cassette domain-containing protein [Nigerium massiliense]
MRQAPKDSTSEPASAAPDASPHRVTEEGAPSQPLEQTHVPQHSLDSAPAPDRVAPDDAPAPGPDLPDDAQPPDHDVPDDEQAPPGDEPHGPLPLLRARGLTASTKRGRIFKPVDLDLYPGQLCTISGEQGSGKSSLLLSLAGRFKSATGELIINGIDASAEPYAVIQQTSVARLGDYVQPEDRLTLDESIIERCFIDGYPRAQGEERVRRMEEALGYRVNRAIELEQLQPVERAVISVALAMIRPAAVVIIDDADTMVPHSQQHRLFELLAELARLDDAVVIASVVDNDETLPSSVHLHLESPMPPAGEPLDAVQVIAAPPEPDNSPEVIS